jgi:hypothetical protein
MRFIVLICAAALIASAASATTYVDKEPDYGAWWHPLCNNNETYIYADTFTCPAGDDVVVTNLGMWLAAMDYYYSGAQHSKLTFEIWQTSGGVPVFGTSLCSTDYVSSENYSLTYVEAPVLNPVALTPGVMYAFVANGYHNFSGLDAYQVGGHTQGQNPGYFFFSNYPDQNYFDGQFYTPEMAFKATLNPIPEPALVAPLAGLILGLGALWRRK